MNINSYVAEDCSYETEIQMSKLSEKTLQLKNIRLADLHVYYMFEFGT